jgi:sialate O-acetylesterase
MTKHPLKRSTCAHITSDRYSSHPEKFHLLALILFLVVPMLHAELKLPAIIGNQMVLQQNLSNPIWGWDAPDTQVTVSFAGQTKSTKAGPDGKWMVKLDPMPANDKPQILTITGTEKRDIQDVLVGEVWMCSGQSNMEFPVANSLNALAQAINTSGAGVSATVINLGSPSAPSSP